MKPPIPQIICPNKSLPEWSLLVQGLGDERLAYLSFFRNNNQIPTIEQARAILGLKEAVATAKPPGMAEPKSAAKTFPKSKTPKAVAPKIMGLKRLRGGKFLSRSHRQSQPRGTSKVSTASSI